MEYSQMSDTALSNRLQEQRDLDIFWHDEVRLGQILRKIAHVSFEQRWRAGAYVSTEFTDEELEYELITQTVETLI